MFPRLRADSLKAENSPALTLPSLKASSLKSSQLPWGGLTEPVLGQKYRSLFQYGEPPKWELTQGPMTSSKRGSDVVAEEIQKGIPCS